MRGEYGEIGVFERRLERASGCGWGSVRNDAGVNARKPPPLPFRLESVS